MDVISDDAKLRFRRVEVLTGPGRRRQWSDEDKARIVVESLTPGSSVTEVARRWQVCPQQVWGWRRQARDGTLALPAASLPDPAAVFVPIVTEPPSVSACAERSTKRDPKPVSCIEIALASAVIRVSAGTDTSFLTEVLRAVRTSAA